MMPADLHWRHVLTTHLAQVRRELTAEWESDHPGARHRIGALLVRERYLKDDLEALDARIGRVAA